MSTVTPADPRAAEAWRPTRPITPTRGSGAKKLPIILGVLTACSAVVLLRSSHAGDTTFQLAVDSDFVQLPDIVVPSMVTAWVMVVVCLALTAEAVRRMLARARQPRWVPIVFAVAWMTGFLSWAAADDRIRVVSLLGGAVALAIPLVFGALGGVLGERAGVVNIAIEGQLLFGAFAAAITASLTGSPWVGLLAAMVAGALVALILGLFAITYFVDQVIVGVVLNVLVVGLTNFLFRQVLTPNAESLNSPDRFSRAADPGAGRHPARGPDLLPPDRARLRALHRRRAGGLGPLPHPLGPPGPRGRRAPQGRRHRRHQGQPHPLPHHPARRCDRGHGWRLLQPGVGRGLQPRDDRRRGLHRAGGGDLRQVGPDPRHAGGAALRLRARTSQGVLSAIGSPVPSQFMLMLPYLVTIFAVAGLVGRSRPPAADGVPYRQQCSHPE